MTKSSRSTSMTSISFDASATCASITVASGTITVTVASGTVVSASVTVASGTVTVASGTITVASGTVIVASGTVIVASGTITVASGTVTVASGTVTVASGTIVSASVTAASGIVTSVPKLPVRLPSDATDAIVDAMSEIDATSSTVATDATVDTSIDAEIDVASSTITAEVTVDTAMDTLSEIDAASSTITAPAPSSASIAIFSATLTFSPCTISPSFSPSISSFTFSSSFDPSIPSFSFSSFFSIPSFSSSSSFSLLLLLLLSSSHSLALTGSKYLQHFSHANRFSPSNTSTLVNALKHPMSVGAPSLSFPRPIKPPPALVPALTLSTTAGSANNFLILATLSGVGTGIRLPSPCEGDEGLESINRGSPPSDPGSGVVGREGPESVSPLAGSSAGARSISTWVSAGFEGHE
ncbi:hypothetical protein BC936DRAFT_148726 [Jimgerdemannia flammicorona]|uniref:Uncharacterized protein n=1 Tax=Jimgerdemannia flammicorona TaxID=994334 RepID=A0A433DKK5_9FUNG|nr:hypothetical protein BC936DRAFT_148726 [Jimgerdemannia flammicorona]